MSEGTINAPLGGLTLPSPDLDKVHFTLDDLVPWPPVSSTYAAAEHKFPALGENGLEAEQENIRV